MEWKLEAHLVDCGECRSRLARLRAGARMARRVPAFKPAHDRWADIQEALDCNDRGTTLRHLPRELRGEGERRTDSRTISGWALILILVLLCCLLFSIRSLTLKAARPSASIDTTAFHEVGIAEIDGNSEAHIVVKGYVAEVRIDSEENTLSFKLVPNLKEPRPFVICEIIGSPGLTLPPVGGQVRVYGVSRYDGQPDHRWYEIHPVMKIEIVNQ